MGNGASKNNFLMDVFLSFEKNEDILNKSFNESFGNYLKKVDSVLSVQENKFIEFNFPHLSAYQLTYEPKTKFHRDLMTNKITELNDEDIVKMFKILNSS